MHDFLKWLNRYWPVIVGVILFILAFGETRVSVFFNTKALDSNQQSDRQQWAMLKDHESRLSWVQGKLDLPLNPAVGSEAVE